MSLGFKYGYGKEGLVDITGLGYKVRFDSWRIDMDQQANNVSGFSETGTCSPSYQFAPGLNGWRGAATGWLDADGTAEYAAFMKQCSTPAEGTWRIGGGSAITGSCVIQDVGVATGYSGGNTRVVLTFVGDGAWRVV